MYPCRTPLIDSRYGRQIALPDFGIGRQRRLQNAFVAIVGLGGVGTPSATYIACAGVGKMRLIDPDDVELSNLNRQFFYREDDVGLSKADTLKQRLNALNPEIKIESIKTKIDADNVGKILDHCDVIVEAVDNFSSRFIINQYCVDKRIPLVHGSIQGTQGQVMAILPRVGPCLQCAFPDAPSRGPLKSPVLGSAAGVIGCIIANEATKMITGYGSALVNKMLVCDLYDSSFYQIPIERNPSCRVCGGSKIE